MSSSAAAARVRGLAPLLLAGALVSGALGATTDPAAELRHAQRALAAGEYDEAYAEYLHFATENDNPLAQFTVALFHQLGWGRPVDRAEACRWHEKAAARDIPAAAHFLGRCLEDGVGRPVDAAGAAGWYRKAADLGHFMSLCALADLHMTGRGVAKDPAKGVALCEEAAGRGAIPAQIRTGRFRLEGDASIRNPQAAWAWFERAAAAGAPEAQYYLGVMSRDGVGRPASSQTALQWFELAASQGYVEAYVPTGELYLERPVDPQSGRLAAEDLAKAYMWLRAGRLRARDPMQLARSQRMLDKVREIMPPSWAPDLDARVAEHLEKFPKP